MEKVLSLKHEASVPTQAHTVAVIKRDGMGQVWLVLECFRPRCGCGYSIRLEELIGVMEGLRGEEKGNGENQRESRAA
jgi:hypothetical protein